ANNYGYGGTDPTGIQLGLIWPYVTQLKSYKCPADNRNATIGGVSKPILRSVSMNSWLFGRTFGDPKGAWDYQTYVTGGGVTPAATLKYKLFIKDPAIQAPSKTWVLLDEDPESINDAMFLVDMETAGGLVDL